LLIEEAALSVKEKWQWFAKVMLANAILVPIIAAFCYFVFQLRFNLSNYPSFLLPLSRFSEFLWDAMIKQPVIEEITYRGIVWLFIIPLDRAVQNQYYKIFFVWILIVVPTLYWAISIHPVPLPVFFAGLTWGWLIVKTRSFWPALVSHGFSNCLLYFLIKIGQWLAPSLLNYL